MAKKTYITVMPNRTGAFLKASRIIAGEGGNIVRVSYDKAVDLHTLFIDVEAEEEALIRIEQALTGLGYLGRPSSGMSTLLVEIRITDVVGGILPVLELLERYDVNISYMNSTAGGEPEQRFVMGLLLRDPGTLERLLREIAGIYPVRLLEEEQNFDNSLFYLKFSGEMQELLGLSDEQTAQFLSESNRTMQLLQRLNESPDRVFDYIRRFARFVVKNRGEAYRCELQYRRLSSQVELSVLIPPCGSNTYLLYTDSELVILDTGYAVYCEELLHTIRSILPEYDRLRKRIYVTHADVDHCGALSRMGLPVYLNQKTADGLYRQNIGISDYRECHEYCFGYTKLNRIISQYEPFDLHQAVILDTDTPVQHEDYWPVGTLEIGDLRFEILEGSGGHLYGECIFLERRHKVVFTGDILVNIKGFSKESAEFNAFAPYLMRSVNVDRARATHMRERLLEMIDKEYLICGGHGPLFQKEGDA